MTTDPAAWVCRLFGHPHVRPTSWKTIAAAGPYDFFSTGRECERCGRRKAERVRLVRKHTEEVA
jgi:hypothetical protein